MYLVKFNCTVAFIMLFYLLPAQKRISFVIDSAINITAKQKHTDAALTRTYFFIADEYMNVEQYDSAQLWLNKIHAILPVKNNSLSNYFLLTRQAEVYYYNNLQQLGVQESKRGLAMAQALNDSLLIADSYNFLGLFYMNIDSVVQSIRFYKKGLPYATQPSYPPQYLSLSKPHHLYGNMAEAYYKLKLYDSAVHYNYLSLEKAAQINWHRGIAVAYSGLGDVYLAMNRYDSAINNYTNSINISKNSGDIDVLLVDYGGLGKCHFERKNNTAANQALLLGFDLLRQYPNINRFYALNFLNNATDVYKKQGDNTGLIKALELKSSVETANITGNNKQIQTILNAGLENEKRILSMQVTAAERKQELANTRLLMALAGIALLAIGFLVYRYYQNQKLAVSGIRHKISQDLHDDIGASLSSLQIYGTIAEQSVQTNPAKAIDMLQKINRQSKEVQENMNDIVWSMNLAKNSAVSLEVKIKNYAAELLQDKNIEFTCDVAATAETQLHNMRARKNILLIIKEAINNIAKHSGATAASLQLMVQGKNILLSVADNGTGFNQAAIAKGNGLANINARCRELNGVVQFTAATGAGTKIEVSIPLAVAGSTGW